MPKRIANLSCEHAEELALIDAADCGNPFAEMLNDAAIAAAQIKFYAGLVTEMKGSSIPMGPDVVNFSVREPRGGGGRIIPFNHPFMFSAAKSVLRKCSPIRRRRISTCGLRRRSSEFPARRRCSRSPMRRSNETCFVMPAKAGIQ